MGYIGRDGDWSRLIGSRLIGRPGASMDRPLAGKERLVHGQRGVLPLVVLMLLLGAITAQGQWLDVPEGFVSAHEKDASESGEWRSLLTVRPRPGPFSDLSEVELREVIGEIDDPEQWLRSRVTADLGDGREAERVFESPDSPFADPMFDVLRNALPQLFEGLETLSNLPLRYCDEPVIAYNASGELHEMACTYPIGPLRQYLVFRLQQVNDVWYYTQVRTMNEKRLRHLIAIANSFEPPS